MSYITYHLPLPGACLDLDIYNKQDQGDLRWSPGFLLWLRFGFLGHVKILWYFSFGGIF